MNTIKKYASKIILLGEYGVIHGGEILASPLSKYTAQWMVEKDNDYQRKRLAHIYDYLVEYGIQSIDLEELKSAIENGTYLQSDIPTGYGLGSSGSITAALYDVFGREQYGIDDLDSLKQDLIDIECCFHRKSSGIDPLVIYLDSPVHINGKGIQILDQPLDMSNYFLIDTYEQRSTGLLVDQYMELAEDPDYMNEIEIYKSLNKNAIAAQLKGDITKLSSAISDISRWQYNFLSFGILDIHKELWRSTLDRFDVSLKLCGAGGGGFMMGYAENEKILEEFSEFDLIRL